VHIDAAINWYSIGLCKKAAKRSHVQRITETVPGVLVFYRMCEILFIETRQYYSLKDFLILVYVKSVLL